MKNLILLLVVVVLTSCEGPRYFSQYEERDLSTARNLEQKQMAEEGLRQRYEHDLSLPENLQFQDSVDGEGNRLVIRSAKLDMHVKDSEESNDSLRWIAKRYGGYLMRTSTWGAELRVDHKQLDAAVDEIARLGKIRSKTFQGSDETTNYYDMGIRLENAQRARMRYLQLLASADDIPSALLVEKELERLNKEIDLLAGKRRGLENLAVHSSIVVNYERTASTTTKPGPLGYVFIGLWKGVKWLFVRNG